MSRMSSLEKENMIYNICANYGDTECIEPKYWKYIKQYNTKENYQKFDTLREPGHFSID